MVHIGTMFSIQKALLSIILCSTFWKELDANTWNQHNDNMIQHLTASPDYRAVKLKWNYYQPTQRLLGFVIRYCELTNWHSKNRCKEQKVSLNSTPFELAKSDTEEAMIRMINQTNKTFEADISNLRMLTNYSLSVRPNLEESNNGWQQLAGNKVTDTKQQSVLVETKSFSARTSRCLANSSEIEVRTGPYFRGKISVEGSNNFDCAIYGNRSNEQSVYHLTINHDLCGSKLINNSRIETIVIVHENKDILTHNSRRYVVVCTFSPEVHTLTASVAVPSHLLKKIFDRIREKQYTLSMSVQNDESASVNGQHPGGNSSTSTDHLKQLKHAKRSFLRKDKLSLTKPNQANLRDSRMLTEVKYHKLEAKVHHNWLEPKLLLGISTMLICSSCLLYTFFVCYRNKIGNSQKAT